MCCTLAQVLPLYFRGAKGQQRRRRLAPGQRRLRGTEGVGTKLIFILKNRGGVYRSLYTTSGVRLELCSDVEHMDRYQENCMGQGKVYIGLAK